MGFLKALSVTLFCSLLLTCTSYNRLPGYIHYRMANNPTTLDPALTVDVNGGLIAAKLFNGLLRLGDGMQVEPDIAESWTVSKDGLSYKFVIRKGVTFSSGREVRAWDFKYSFERVLDPETKSPQTWIFEHVLGAREFMRGEAEEVRGLRAVDEYTLEIKLESTFSPFPGLLTMPAAYVVPMEQVLLWGPDFSSHPVGTGPYMLEEWLPNRHVKLSKREGYFGGVAGSEGIIYRIIPEELTAVAEFELGNLDVITVPLPEYSRYQKSPEWKGLLSGIEGLNTYYLGLNCERPPFDNPNMRTAMSLAVDRAKMLGALYEGMGGLASGPIPKALRKWEAPEPFPYEPALAGEIVAAEWGSQRALDFLIPSDQQVVDVAEVIQSYLRQAGLEVRITPLEWSAFKEAVSEGKADMFWLSWWADYPDPENFLFPTFHSSNKGPGGNRARYLNLEVDALIEKGQRSTSEAERNASYAEAEAVIASDAPWVFFWHRMDVALRQPWVRNFRMYPVYSMDKGLDTAI